MCSVCICPQAVVCRRVLAPPRVPEAEGAIEAVIVSIVKGTLTVRDVSRHFINLNDAAQVSDP